MGGTLLDDVDKYDVEKLKKVDGVFNNVADLFRLHRKTAALYGELVLSLINKFTPAIKELPRDHRNQVMRDALCAWAEVKDTRSFRFEIFEQPENLVMFRMLDCVDKAEFAKLMRELGIPRKQVTARGGLKRDMIGTYTVTGLISEKADTLSE